MKPYTFKYLSLLILGAISACDSSSSSYADAMALTKAHVAFVNADTYDLGLEADILIDRIVVECAATNLERLRTLAANESIKQALGFVSVTKSNSATAIAKLLGKVEALDKQGPRELRCIATLTIMRESLPDTWNLVAKLNADNRNALQGVERMIDTAKM